MSRFQFRFLVLIVISFISLQVYAQDKVWTGSVDSSWHTAGNWSPSGVPGTTQTVAIRGNTTPRPVVTSNVTVRSVTINSWWNNPGDQLKIRNNATLTITDDLAIYGTGKLDIINGHLLMSATTNGSNNLDLNGTPVIEITNGSATFGTASEDLDIEIIGSFYTGYGTVTVYGDLDVSNADNFYVENGTVNVNGSTLVNGTYHGDDGTSNFYGEVEVRSGGIMDLNTGTLNFNETVTIGNSGYVYFGSGTVNIMADVNVSSGGYFNVQNANVSVTGSASFTSNGNMSVDNGSITIGGNASLSSGGVIDLNSGSLNVGGDASFTAGGTVNAGNSTITLEGDFTINNNSNFSPDSGTVVFSGDSTQTVNAASDVVFHNVVIDSGAVFNTDGGSENTVTIEGNLTVNEGGGVVVEEDDQLDVQGEVGGGGSGNIQSPAPFAVSAVAPDTISVVITFNKAMVESYAENTANYSVIRISNSAAVTVTSAVLNTSGDNKQVTLTFATPVLKDAAYQITMNNLQSTDGGVLSTNHKKNFTKFGPVTFYSITSGAWTNPATWSRSDHAGAAATTYPGSSNSTTNATVYIGNSDVVTISSAVTITNQNAVQVKTGATLRVNTGGTLTTGTKAITGAGTFEVAGTGALQIGSTGGISASGATGNVQTATRIFGASGTYRYNGTAAQVIGTGLPSSVANLRIQNAAGVTLNANLEVTGTLYLTSGSFTIASGNNLIANTKSITSGDLIVQHTITGTNGWRLLSSPVASDYDDFLDGIVTQGYSGAFYSTGSDPGDTLQPNVMWYDETYPGTDNQRWRAPATAGTSLTTGRGLYTYIFGNIAADSRYNNDLPATLNVQGQEHEGPVNLNVTYTTDADSGWNLVGNPYAATIDWDDAANWTKDNIDETIYVWDYTSNQYRTWNGTTGDLPSQGKIAPFQGFWIKANNEDPDLIVDEDAKTTGGIFVGKATSASQQNDPPMLSLVLANDSKSVTTHFMFTEYARLGKDRSDGYRLLPLPGIGDYLELSTVTESGEKFAINNLPRRFGRPIEIPLVIEAYKDGVSESQALNLQISQLKNIPPEWRIYLIDDYTGEEILVQNGSIIPFHFVAKKGKVAPNMAHYSQPKVTSRANTSDARFILRIEPGADAQDLPDQFEVAQNYPNPFNPSTKIQFSLPIQSRVELNIFDMLGRHVATLVSDELSAGVHTYQWNAQGLASGMYIYRLVSSEGIVTKKMTLIK